MSQSQERATTSRCWAWSSEGGMQCILEAGHQGKHMTLEGINQTPDPLKPAYYKGDLVMRIIEHFGLGFRLGNTIKYILRHGAKAGVEDLKKGRWYLDREIQYLEGTLKGDLE